MCVNFNFLQNKPKSELIGAPSQALKGHSCDDDDDDNDLNNE